MLSDRTPQTLGWEINSNYFQIQVSSLKLEAGIEGYAVEVKRSLFISS